MKVKHSLLPLCGLLQLLCCAAAAAQQISLTPTFHSIGYRVELPPGYDADSTAVTDVRYRAAGQDWQPGFPAARLALGELRGSLFQLNPATAYELELSLVDSFPVFKKDLLTASAVTRTLPDIQPAGTLRWVSPVGSGTAYSESNPGSFQALLAAGLPCGTTVLLKGGDYPLGDLVLNLSEDCPETAPITIMAAPGETPVFDGGSYASYAWSPTAADSNIWWTTLPPDLDFNALCLVDGERMYPYAFLDPPAADPTYPSLRTLGYDLPGFYRNKQNQVFIKTLDHRDINGSEVIFSQKFSFLNVRANHKNVRLRIKGLRFKYYGKGLCAKDIFGNPTECYPSYTLRFENAGQVVVDSCRFDFCNYPVTFEGNCNDNLVMHCRITDGTGYWSHAAFKRTIDVVAGLFDPTFGTYGRYLENTGIHFRPATGQSVQGNVVWRNTVQGVVNGIGLGFPNTSVMAGSDIAENEVSWCYDGIGALAEHRNVRIWGNRVSHCPVGASLISRAQKPAYIFRNVFHHLDQRQNYQTDPNFLSCANVETHQSWSTALKLNAGSELDSTDLIYFIHNTVHGTEALAFNLYLWQPTWKVLQLRNNLFYAEGEANFMFDGVKDQPGYSFESVGDNVVNPGSGVPGLVRPQHGAPDDCLAYQDAKSLSDGLAAVTGSPFAFLKNTLGETPQFVDAAGGDFRLLPASPLIDRGVPVPGFNHDFRGLAPDVGAFESPDSLVSVRPADSRLSGLRIFPNPSSGVFYVRFTPPESTGALEVWDMQGHRHAVKKLADLPAGEQAIAVEMPELPAGVYWLKVRFGVWVGVGRLVVM